MDKQPGFSLLELILVLAVIGILTAIAYPSYTNYLFKSRRSEAVASLTQIQMRLERCFAQHDSYKVPCADFPTFPMNSRQNFYKISLSNLDTTTYKLTARPQFAQAKDSTCALMSVNQANVKIALDSSGRDQMACWSLR